MASITLANVANIAEDRLLAGIIAEFITTDNFSGMLPFVAANGKTLTYSRELTDPKTTVGYLNVGSTVVASAPTYTQITEPLGRVGGDAEVDGFVELTQSNVQDVRETQIASKVRGIARKFSEGVIKGSGTFPQFAGINHLVDSSNMWLAAGSTTIGGALTFAKMDNLMDYVTVDANDYFFLMPRKIRRKLKALYRALGGAAIETVEIGWRHPVTTEDYSQLILAYEDVPVFLNDNITSESTYGVTNKFRVSFGAFGESVGLTGIMPFDNDPGIRIKPVGQSETKDATIDRVVMYTGQALYSTKGISQLVNLAS